MLLLALGLTFLVSDAFASSINLPASANEAKNICTPPPNPSSKLEKTISQCQEEIKFSLLQEAVSVLGKVLTETGSESKGRPKREVFTGEEKRIAGCLLQCLYHKMNAVDENGLPTPTGLVSVYSEGVSDRNYYLATIQGVQLCMSQELKFRQQNPEMVRREGYSCDAAYDIFNCVTDQIESLCGIPSGGLRK